MRRNWRIRDGKTIQPRFDGKHKNHGWQYPGVWEHESNVYVIYSVGKEDCEVAILPLNSLQVKEYTVPNKKTPSITRRALLKTLAATGVGAASRSSTAKAASIEEEKLWIGDAIDFRTMPYVPGIEHVLVHRAVKGEYQWLHGPQIIAHRGVLSPIGPTV